MELIHCHAYFLNKIELNYSMRQHQIIIPIATLFSLLTSQNGPGFEINGTAAYKSGTLLENAEVTLMDTTEKVIARTKTSKKILKRFGGGAFHLKISPMVPIRLISKPVKKLISIIGLSLKMKKLILVRYIPLKNFRSINQVITKWTRRLKCAVFLPHLTHPIPSM